MFQYTDDKRKLSIKLVANESIDGKPMDFSDFKFKDDD